MLFGVEPRGSSTAGSNPRTGLMSLVLLHEALRQVFWVQLRTNTDTSMAETISVKQHTIQLTHRNPQNPQKTKE